MTDLTPIECEARLMGFKKESRADGEWTSLTFQIHPDDTPHALFLLPLKTHVMLSIKGTDEGAKTEQSAVRAKPAIGPICMRAVLKCKNVAFQRWFLGFQPPDAAERCRGKILALCNIESRKELDLSDEAAKVFESIESRFQAAQRGQSGEAQQTQLESGPA